MRKNTKTVLYQSAISKGITYLWKIQLHNGSFASYTAAEGRDSATGESRSTTFHTSLILSALEAVRQNPTAEKVATKAIRFLLSQKSPDWSWNYWTKGSPEFSSIRVPDDLDDTFAALSAIDAWHPERVDEYVMLAAARILMATETAPGGPYNTWIIDGYTDTVWEDIDLGVNANSMYFLHRKEVTLEPMMAYFDQAIRTSKLTSRYYSPLSVTYLIAKWYQGNESATLLHQLKHKRKSVTNSLAAALFITSYIRLGGDAEKIADMITRLRDMQNRDGSWDAAPFFIEQIKQGVPQWSGSQALTTACVIEALIEYDRGLKKKGAFAEKAARSQKARIIHKRMQHRFSGRSIEMQKAIKMLGEKIVAHDELHEVALLPYFFAKNMRNSPKPSKVTDLCVMNLFGWIGYSICDKILDGEDAISMLPVATICIREVSLILRRILPNNQDYALATEIVDLIDETNFWEHTACKLQRTKKGLLLPKTLPDYQNNMRLAEKSLGHILGPLTLVLRSKGSRKQRLGNAKILRSFFEHYLIARQLNDDAHDWSEDLRNGFLNGASVTLVAAWQKKIKRNTLILKKDQSQLDEIFWHSTIDIVARDILAHSKKARTMLKHMTFLANTDFLEVLLVPLERSAEKAIAERDATLKLLALCKH